MKNKSLLILLTIIFLDMLGVGILYPVVTPLLLNPENGLLNPAWSETTVNVTIGLLIATYPFFQFFGAPIIGKLSDNYGRKKLLKYSLFGSMIGYLVFALGVWLQALPLLFLSRILDGFTGGNIAVAQSAISDISKPEEKAKNFGLVGMIFGFGFIFGPFIGGLLSDSNLVSWFNPSLPFLFAAALSFTNFLAVLFFFKETHCPEKFQPIVWITSLLQFKKALTHQEWRHLFTAILLYWLGFSFFTQFLPVSLVRNLGFNESQIGLVYGFIGLCIAINQGVLVRILSKKYSPASVLRVSMLGASLMIGASVLAVDWTSLLISQFSIALFVAVTMPNISALVSNLAGKDNQGEMLGMNQSLHAFGQFMAPLAGGLVLSLGSHASHWFSAGFIFLGWLTYQTLVYPKIKT